nr:secondary thiamine-phosphate synthase enzyme YjbQ [Sphingomonas limnosediminicola]
MLRQSIAVLPIRASRQGLIEITDAVQHFLTDSGITDGLLTVFCRHTSASLVIQENAAPAARRDLEAFLTRLAPESAEYEHDDEGPDDMPAHLRAALTATQLSVPVMARQPMLGTWQGIFLFEHRRRPPEREIVFHVVGE